MKLYNTLTRRKEEFVPLSGNKVNIYGCGPTVYNLIHVGNARMLVVFDTLTRFLRYKGYDVTFARNYTDIDDKIIDKANAEGADFTVISERYIKEFETDAAGLNVLPPDISPRASEHIPDILGIISALEEKGYAYVIPGDGVYYRVEKFADYGKLSRKKLDDLEAGARVGANAAKEHPGDFALWKFAKPGEPSMSSPWGAGRPGWHIECSAMAGALLGETIDIHCGGEDLQFPHHENEIAQSEAAHGKPFARFWLHNAFVNVDNRKMSKSLNNFFTVRGAAADYGYETIRFSMLKSHYRSPVNYSAEQSESDKAALERLYAAKRNLEHVSRNGADGDDPPEFPERLRAYLARFDLALEDDLNTADALGILFDMVRDINAQIQNVPRKSSAATALDALMKAAGLLGLLYQADETLPADVEELLKLRETARKERNWAESDRLRDSLKEKGYAVEDTGQGQKTVKIS